MFSVRRLMAVDRGGLEFCCHREGFLGGRFAFDIIRFHLWQVELLWAEDRARPRDPDPADEGFGRDLVMFHCPEADQGACATETSLAVDCDCAGLFYGEMLVSDLHPLIDDRVRRRGTVDEKQVIVGNT